MLKTLFEEGEGIEAFYESLNPIYENYINRMKMNVNFSYYDSIIRKLRAQCRLLVIAEKECIDSIVNLYILKHIYLNTKKIEIQIVTKKQYKEVVHGEMVLTPTIILMDEFYEERSRWVRVPKVMKEIEESEDQSMIIDERRRYREGYYLIYTFDEILDLILK